MFNFWTWSDKQGRAQKQGTSDLNRLYSYGNVACSRDLAFVVPGAARKMRLSRRKASGKNVETYFPFSLAVLWAASN